MAKKVVATLQTGAVRNFTKTIKMIKSPKTGAYIFKEEIINNENVSAYFAKK